MPSENNCIMEDVDNEVNFLNPYDFNDSDSFDSDDDDDGNCVDTCENNSFNSNDNDGLESFTFDDNSLINEHVGELHDMLCNVDDELNVDASLLDLNDVEFDTFHDNCLDDAIYIHDLLGEEKEETDGDLRDVLLSSEKEEEKESVTIEKENEEENFENMKVLFEEVHDKIIEEEKEKTRNESVREEVDEKLKSQTTRLRIAAIGLLTTYLEEDHFRYPSTTVAFVGEAERVNVTPYEAFWFSSEKFKVGGTTVTLTPSGGTISTVYEDLASPTFVTVLVYVCDPDVFTSLIENEGPGSLALDGLTWPAPSVKMSAGRRLSSSILFFPRLVVSAVVMIADFIAAGDQSGCALLSKAATPDRCGHDIEVPEIMLNVDFVSVLFSTETGQAAMILTPGPTMSGFRIPGLALPGPRDEKTTPTTDLVHSQVCPRGNSRGGAIVASIDISTVYEVPSSRARRVCAMSNIVERGRLVSTPETLCSNELIVTLKIVTFPLPLSRWRRHPVIIKRWVFVENSSIQHPNDHAFAIVGAVPEP
nr:hypothetical protein Iba_chr08aCG11710 [Ipomoea batatas]